MFLHPVNVRCLLREYGSLEASPDTITATVVEIVGHTVTEVSNGHSQFLKFSVERESCSLQLFNRQQCDSRSSCFCHFEARWSDDTLQRIGSEIYCFAKENDPFVQQETDIITLAK